MRLTLSTGDHSGITMQKFMVMDDGVNRPLCTDALREGWQQPCDDSHLMVTRPTKLPSFSMISKIP